MCTTVASLLDDQSFISRQVKCPHVAICRHPSIHTVVHSKEKKKARHSRIGAWRPSLAPVSLSGQVYRSHTFLRNVSNLTEASSASLLSTNQYQPNLLSCMPTWFDYRPLVSNSCENFTVLSFRCSPFGRNVLGKCEVSSPASVFFEEPFSGGGLGFNRTIGLDWIGFSFPMFHLPRSRDGLALYGYSFWQFLALRTYLYDSSSFLRSALHG